MGLLMGGKLFHETLDLVQCTFCHIRLLSKDNVYCITRSPTKRSAHYAYWRPNAGRQARLAAGARDERTLAAGAVG